CHQKSVLGTSGDAAMLDRLGIRAEVPDTGCCGMAGSFGFEAKKVHVSMQCGERVLLPAVRAAAADTLVVANGYSCREQIEQTTGRRVHHLAEILKWSLRDV